ncbi:MAG: hypothetical protein ACOYOK_08620 [Pseudobdellovibrionaceae bacterium]
MGLKNSKNRRNAYRKEITPLQVSSISSLENLAKIARNAEVIEASSSGLLLIVKRESLIPVALRKNLNIDSLVGNKVSIHLSDMNLEIAGTITRTQLLGKKGYHVAVDYTEDSPAYWRECLMDLLPAPGEIDSEFEH